MKRIEVPAGTKFGRLTTIKEVEKIDIHRAFLCKCECGNETIVQLGSLRSGNTKSCGCLRNEAVRKQGIKFIDLEDEIFGMLKVIRRAKNSPTHKTSRWLCRCECGNEVVVSASNLRTGSTRSCGCQKGSYKGIRKWTKEDDKEVIRLKNSGKDNREISKEINRGSAAIAKRLSDLSGVKGVKLCAAKNCGKQFIPYMSNAKYCTDKCRWQENKRRKYEKRRVKGSCPQCGGVMDNDKVTYCSKCQEYFQKRYEMKKSDRSINE